MEADTVCRKAIRRGDSRIRIARTRQFTRLPRQRELNRFFRISDLRRPPHRSSNDSAPGGLPKHRTEYLRTTRHRSAYAYGMDKKEINSPKLTIHFVVWMTVGGLLLLAFLGHYMWKVF